MSKRIVSFDVGIKNLAYCVFSVSPAEKCWHIDGWTCANLLTLDSPTETPHLCTQIITTGKKGQKTEHPCNKTAKWAPPIEGGMEYYCETHAKMHTEWIIPKKQHQSSQIKKLKLPELVAECKSIGICTTIDGGGIAKKADLIERITKFYESKCYRSAVSNSVIKSAGETDLVTIGRAIRRQLDSDASLDGITHVIIENQISTIASRMKTIQGMIAQYFIMRFGDKTHIEFVSSHNKLKGFSQTVERKESDKEKASYKANKSDGVAICRQFFHANPTEMGNWSAEFERSKKRDDLADCFLQGIWYLSFHKIIYYAEDLKINSVFVS